MADNPTQGTDAAEKSALKGGDGPQLKANDTAGMDEQVKARRAEMQLQKSDDREPGFASKKFGRIEITDDDGKALVRGKKVGTGELILSGPPQGDKVNNVTGLDQQSKVQWTDAPLKPKNFTVDVDGDGHPTQVKYPDGSSVRKTEQGWRNEKGQVVDGLDVNDAGMATTTDKSGKAVIRYPDGSSIKRAADGDITEFSDSRGTWKKTGEDSYKNEKTGETQKMTVDARSDGSSWVVKDAAGRPTGMRMANGDSAEFKYDADGKVNEFTDRTGSWKREADGKWVNEKTGQHKEMNIEVSKWGNYTVSENGEKTVRDQDGGVLHFDKSGHLSDAKYADGREFHFNYGPDGKVNEVTDNNGTWKKSGDNTWVNSENGQTWKGTIDVNADGRQTYTNMAGDKTTIFPSGSRRVELPSKKEIEQGDKVDQSKHTRPIDDAARKYIKDEGERQRFQKDMEAFEERAKRQGLTEQQIQDTYKQIERLMQPDDPRNPGKIDQADRIHIAEQIMRQCAFPTDVSQGGHNTCNVTTVECRLYARTPEAVAKLVADVATTGEFRTANGTTIKLDAGSLKPDKEAKVHPPEDNKRTYASQLFQVTAVNIECQRGGCTYKQGTPGARGDTGEGLYDKDGKKVMDSPFLADASQYAFISNQINGKNELASDVVVSGYSEKELAENLAKAKAEGKMPVIVIVTCNREPFSSDGGFGSAGGFGDLHVVTVTDYDPKTGKASVDNQWKRENDHLGEPGGTPRIKAGHLWRATPSGMRSR